MNDTDGQPPFLVIKRKDPKGGKGQTIIHVLMERKALSDSINQGFDKETGGAICVPIKFSLADGSEDLFMLEVFDSTRVDASKTLFARSVQKLNERKDLESHKS